MKKLKLLSWTLALCLVVLVLSVEGWSFYRFMTQPISFVNHHNTDPGATSANARPILTIPEGSSAKQVAKLLYQQQLIRHPVWFVWVLKYEGKSQRLKAGEFEIDPDWTVHQLIDALVEGRMVQYPATLIAGKTLAENLQVLTQLKPLSENSDNLDMTKLSQALNISGSLEGQFLPETYYYHRGEDLLSVLKRAHQALQQSLQAAWQDCQSGLPLKTPYEVLILASIVEKETGYSPERPMIAGVFINRLNKGMRLQSDPTIIYGMGDVYDGNIRKKDIQTLTPYNTYRIKGLPPTPIALPSVDAIRAVCQPAKTPALYFVAKGEGQHQFSNSLIEHNRAVQQYLLKK